MSESQLEKFEEILRERALLNDGEVMTDAILIAAIEKFDDTTGYVRIYPDGSQPQHVSVGLLTECLNELQELARED